MKILVPGRGFQELNGDLVRRSLGVGSSRATLDRQYAAEEKAALSETEAAARTLLTAASHALRSYEFGNGAADLARSTADKIDAFLLEK